MKKFKKLQDNVNESLNSIRDEQLLKSLKHQNECLNKKATSQKHKSFRLAMVSSCIAAILIVASIVIPLILKTDVPQDHFSYTDINQVSSTVEELNEYTKFFDLDSSMNHYVTKCFDKTKTEVLYFIVNTSNDETFESITLSILVNDNFKIEPFTFPYDKEYYIANHKLSYYEDIETDDDGISFIKVQGNIITKKERIYITYDGVGFDGESPFLETLEKLFIVS